MKSFSVEYDDKAKKILAKMDPPATEFVLGLIKTSLVAKILDGEASHLKADLVLTGVTESAIIELLSIFKTTKLSF